MKQPISREFSFPAPSSSEIKDVAKMYRAVKHLLRIQILNYLNVNKYKTVTEIHLHFNLEQSVTSQHLSVLRKAGAVKTDRDGKFIFYSVNYDFFKKLTSITSILND